MRNMQWFRLYGDIIDDSKLKLLAFEDRWHYVAICACKCNGLLDKPDDDLRARMMAVSLGLQVRELEELKRRLLEVKLIDENWHPSGWDKRQYKQPGLPKGESLEGYKGYVYFISDNKRETVKIGYSKNPWARVKDLQTGRTAKLSVVATIKTTEVSENDIHWIFEDERQSGDWFTFSPRIQALIKAIKSKEVFDASAVADYVSNYVVATKDTETDTETDIKDTNVSSAASGTPPDDFTFSDFEDAWQETAEVCGLPKMRAGARKRRQRAFAVRKREFPEMDDWRTAFATLRKAKWMHGDNGRNWRCDADDFLNATKFSRLVEGKYAETD